mgnify:CR=1 FL=1
MKKKSLSFLAIFFVGIMTSPMVLATTATTCAGGEPDGHLPPGCQCAGERISCTFPPAG